MDDSKKGSWIESSSIHLAKYVNGVIANKMDAINATVLE
jgi:hypothetical protein